MTWFSLLACMTFNPLALLQNVTPLKQKASGLFEKGGHNWIIGGNDSLFQIGSFLCHS
jgi:hypothetical protein